MLALAPYIASMNGIFFNGSVDENYLGHQFSEIYKDNLYGPYLKDKKDLVVVDIGANIGLFTLRVKDIAKTIYSIEPAPEHFECLSKMIEFNGIKNVTLINKAISQYNKKSDFYYHFNKTANSLFPIASEAIASKVEVECIRMDTVFEQYKIDHVDFMKFDAEGIEAEVFGGDAFAKVSDKIDMIFFETHAWMDRNERQVIGSLEIRGFKVSPIPYESKVWIAQK